MLSNVVQHVNIGSEWVATEYLRRCKKGAWKKENTVDTLKCYNLEHIIIAAQFNLGTPDEVAMDQYMNDIDNGN